MLKLTKQDRTEQFSWKSLRYATAKPIQTRGSTPSQSLQTKSWNSAKLDQNEYFFKEIRKETELKHSCAHPDVTYLNPNLYIHVVSLCKSGSSHPKLPLPLLSPPFFFSLHLTLFVPRFLFSLPQMSAHQLRSDGWEEQTGFYRACTHSHTNTGALANLHAQSTTEWPETAGIQDFCPWVWSFLSVFTLSHLFAVYDHISMKQMPQTHMWLQTNMDYGQRRSGIWLFLCSNRISVSFLCVRLIWKWLDGSFGPREWGRVVVKKRLLMLNPWIIFW